MSVPVTSKRAPQGHEKSATTLGDLLLADCSSERDWVDLLARIATGDQHALRILYQRTHRLVFTLAVRICGSREHAEEVTLDVFHDVWRRASDYRPTGSVIAWIMMQARSRSIDRMRFEQRKKRVRIDGDDAAEPAPMSTALETRQRQQTLREALTALTGDERKAIETAFFSELSYAETAAELDEPVGTIKTRVRSALAKLRAAIEGDGE
jgi:RNA polymerase sigma-70 factor, ECF subfamily